MSIRKIVMGAAATAMLSISMVGMASAAHNANKSFETGIAVAAGGFSTLFSPDSTSIDNWTVSAGSVDYINGYWQASDGTRSLDMSGNEAGAVSKTFSTVAGHTYTVTFDLAGNPDPDPDNGPEVKTLNVDAGDSTSTYAFDTAGQSREDMGWESKTFDFTATGTSTTLTFTSLNDSAFGPALDNVVMTNTTVPTNKDQCKKDVWKVYQNPSFKNQGDCVSYIQSSSKAVGNRADN